MLIIIIALTVGSAGLITEQYNSHFFLVGDNVTYFLPSYVYNWRAVIEQGTIPLINFHQFLGQTYLGLDSNPGNPPTAASSEYSPTAEREVVRRSRTSRTDEFDRGDRSPAWMTEIVRTSSSPATRAFASGLIG